MGSALGLGDLGRGHLGGKLVADLSCIFITLGAGEIAKQVCSNIILGNALAGGVHQPEAELRVGVPLLGGAAEPLDGFGVILGDSYALGVNPAEFVFVPLFLTRFRGPSQRIRSCRPQRNATPVILHRR